jgi:exosortase/archaeosortase family protein
MAGTATIGGILLAVSKLFVLAPTMVVFPLFHWKQLVSEYSSEGIVALIILLNSVPRRALETLWPWYGQILGRFVYTMAQLLVSGLGYENDLNPTVTGPDMDIAILPACSGIHGLELLGYLFGLLAFLDWNRLGKSRALLVYFAGSFVMLLSNALRITSFIVLGNRGFIDFVSRFHQSAG